jgi:hypothetical protein
MGSAESSGDKGRFYTSSPCPSLVCSHPAGVNSGQYCIFGDVDCDGDPKNIGGNSAGQQLMGVGGIDFHALDQGEFMVIVLNFGTTPTVEMYESDRPSNLIVIGVPSSTVPGAETYATMRAARYPLAAGPAHITEFGNTIGSATVAVYNYDVRNLLPPGVHLSRCQ